QIGITALDRTRTAAVGTKDKILKRATQTRCARRASRGRCSRGRGQIKLLSGTPMKLLYAYLRNYWGLVILALTLAAINQVFSLLDPLILRDVIDRYATRVSEYNTHKIFKGVSGLLGAAVSVAFVSRVAKNFQDYYINVITQRLGAQLYSDGIRHSLALPYSVFEDQRSGETLGKLQKVRTDVEKLITAAINVLFTSL